MEKFCLDTNVISDFMRKDANVDKNMRTAMKDDNSIIFIPTIVFYEVARGLKAAGKTRRLQEFFALYKNFQHLFFDRDSYAVINKATEIYVQLHKSQQIEDADIFIAAIALVNDCTLVTANVRHFERVEGLKIVNWKIN